MVAFIKRNPRRQARLLFTLLLCALFVCSAAHGSASDPGVKTVRVGWFDSAFNYMDASGRRSGYAYEYEMKVSAYAGWNYEYVEGSWPELLEMLSAGEIDLLADVSYTEEREKSMLFPTLPMGTEEYYIFVSSHSRGISSADYSALNGRRIGVNKGSIQAGFFREWAKLQGVECTLVELTGSEEDSLRMLDRGDLDAFVAVNSIVRDPEAGKDGPVPVCRIGSSDFYFALSRERADLLSDLEYAMRRVQEEDRFYNEKLSEKHLAPTGANGFLTAEEESWLAEHGPIRIGYQDHYLAFCARDPKTGELTGALKDCLDAVSDSILNARIDFAPVAFETAEDALNAMRRGEVDCVFPANLSVTDAESMGVLMTPALMRTDVLAVVRQTGRQHFSRKEHVVVAVNQGNPNYVSCLQENFPGWQIVYYPTTADCLKAVSQRVADCVLISSLRYSNIERQCDRYRLTVIETGVEIDYRLAAAPGNPLLYSILSRVACLVSKPSVDTALFRYVTEDARLTVLDFLEDHIWAVIGIVAAMLLVVLFLMLRTLRAERKAERLIAATETDALTGLYNRDYFLQYASRLRLEHPDVPMDAIVIDIERFHAVNALNGRFFGDQVLRALGSEILAVARENGGIAGRFEADRFDICCRPLPDYSALYNRLQSRMDASFPAAGLRLRAGVMPWEREAETVQQFDRARTACSLARQNISQHLVIFDEEMLKKEIYEQRLLNDLPQALSSYQFEAYYQPQFDIRFDPPKLIGAEALIRWNHPEFGLISPDDFIPLFEKNGKIGDVDQFIWSEAAKQVSRWRDLYGITLPVSVNLSRVDVFNPALESVLDRILQVNGISRSHLKLEVTESAYTGNADQVIRVVAGLRQKGYVVEMDDFGSGYSSLNMLSRMPVDVLKMDRAFIRKLGDREKDSSLVALILGIARSLKIPVVAEGVETEEQLSMLRHLGCSLVQGYYFSVPLTADDFEMKMIRDAASSEKEGDD